MEGNYTSGSSGRSSVCFLLVRSLYVWCQSLLMPEIGRNLKENHQDAISIKLLGGKLAPQLVYGVLKKELFNFIKRHPDPIAVCQKNIANAFSYEK